jgi:solute carrier family 39 (zinc transporter), member 1/2/3
MLLERLLDTSANSTVGSNSTFDPENVNLVTADPTAVICYLTLGQNQYSGGLGARISALFVILIVSTAATFFPVLAATKPSLRIPVYVYLFARFFGAGVIVATAFIQYVFFSPSSRHPTPVPSLLLLMPVSTNPSASLLDPAYGEIGPQTCVGMTGGWANYSYVVGIVFVTVMLVFLLDFGAERYVEIKYGYLDSHPDVEGLVTTGQASKTHQAPHSSDPQDVVRDLREDEAITDPANKRAAAANDPSALEKLGSDSDASSAAVERSFQQQIAAFLILEFGVIFHSIFIGLNLGTAGPEFATLYPVLVFHQSFEGLGIGARLSAIPIPKRLSWLPWALCTAYGLTTPITIAIGLGLRTTYNSGSYTANVVNGVLDAISAGILIYTGLVELLARDFIFNPERTRDNKRLTFMLVCLFLGAALMALLGKWA